MLPERWNRGKRIWDCGSTAGAAGMRLSLSIRPGRPKTLGFIFVQPIPRILMDGVLHHTGLLPNLTSAQDHPFVGGQFFQAHRASGMEALSADRDFGAQTELGAISETSACIDINRR